MSKLNQKNENYLAKLKLRYLQAGKNMTSYKYDISCISKYMLNCQNARVEWWHEEFSNSDLVALFQLNTKFRLVSKDTFLACLAGLMGRIVTLDEIKENKQEIKQIAYKKYVKEHGPLEEGARVILFGYAYENSLV